jgi:hypothetical protein
MLASTISPAFVPKSEGDPRELHGLAHAAPHRLAAWAQGVFRPATRATMVGEIS